jgi:hypothetical protein
VHVLTGRGQRRAMMTYERAPRARVVLAICAALVSWSLVLCAGASANVFPATPTGEFLNPSPNGPPTVSAFNTTPACQLTAADNYYCQVSTSSQPPQDSSNPERYLNSAYWPAEKRPDIETYAINSYGYGYQNCRDKLPHYCFLLDAEAEGYPVTHTPQVGDLWLAPGECSAYGPGAAVASNCSDDANDWYLGYVEQVFPDGSFIQSGGGAVAATDSGISEAWFSGAMDPYTEFIGFFPAGQSPNLPTEPMGVTVYADPSNVNGSNVIGAGSVSDSTGQTCASSKASAPNSNSFNACFLNEPQGSPIAFTETAAAGSKFIGWGGACTGTSTTCTVTITPGTSAGLSAEFAPSGAGGGTSTGPARPKGPKPSEKPIQILRVTTDRATIHVKLSSASTHPVCELFRRSQHRWKRLHKARCGLSVTYSHLAAGTYRLSVVSGKKIVTRTIVLRRGAPR